MLLSSGDRIVLRLIDLVNIGAERNYVVVVVGTHRGSSVVICLDLIIIVDSIVMRLGLYLIVVKVEDGSFAPIAVECKERSIKVNAVLVYVIKGKVALNVHTVCKVSIKVRLILARKSDGYANLRGCTGSNGNDIAIKLSANYRVLGAVREQVCHLCYVLGL